MDTKGDEIAFVADCIRKAGAQAVMVDVGVKGNPAVKADISRQQVAEYHPTGESAVFGTNDRERVLDDMSRALEQFVLQEFKSGKLMGVIALGGSTGTALIAPALRALPVGVPKIMVSTVAGANTSPYVDCSDLVMMPSVADIAGMNALSRDILSNAAHAVTGMVMNRTEQKGETNAVGMTMFGVTTPCVDSVRRDLEGRGYDCLVFHAVGTGGRAMEKLVESGMIRFVLDITTTEVADEIAGGIFKAGAARFDVSMSKGIPYILSVGAMDMVNFGAKETVPEKFRGRNLYVHNSQITLMRTSPEENRECARWMAQKMNKSTGPLLLLLPEKGLSALDAPGQPFHDPEADEALFNELESAMEQTPARQIRRLPLHINDPEFSKALIQGFEEIYKGLG